MDYELIRSERKTVEIKVDIDGAVTVRAPIGASSKYIDGFVSSKEDWIKAAQEKMRLKREQLHKNNYTSARFLGKSYPIAYDDKEKKARFDGRRFILPADKSDDEKKKLLSAWYKKQARRIFEQRLAHLTEATGTSYSKLRISGARTRWGSCTSEGVVSLSWKLIMAEGRAIDYVILHELAHTIEMSHSDDFWGIVEGWMPGYKGVKEYLKDFSLAIAAEGWNS